MRLRFTPQAQRDIEKIYAYLDQRSPSGAYNVSVAIYAASRFIAERPEASPLTEKADVRVKVLLPSQASGERRCFAHIESAHTE